MYLLRAPRPLPPRSGLRAHELLVLERVLLAGAVLSLGVHWRLALPLILAGVVVSWVSQRRMRERYEFGPPEPRSSAGLPESHPPEDTSTVAPVAVEVSR